MSKMFDLSYEEVDPVQAMYNTEECPHRICAEPRLLLDCMANLPTGSRELTLSVTPQALAIKNDVDDAQVESSLRTEMVIAPGDLHEYTLGALATNPLRVGLSMREFKAMLAFAESCGGLVVLHFDLGGRPIVLVTDLGEAGEAGGARLECVIATTIDPEAAAMELFDGVSDVGGAHADVGPAGLAPPELDAVVHNVVVPWQDEGLAPRSTVDDGNDGGPQARGSHPLPSQPSQPPPLASAGPVASLHDVREPFTGADAPHVPQRWARAGPLVEVGPGNHHHQGISNSAGKQPPPPASVGNGPPAATAAVPLDADASNALSGTRPEGGGPPDDGDGIGPSDTDEDDEPVACTPEDLPPSKRRLVDMFPPPANW